MPIMQPDELIRSLQTRARFAGRRLSRFGDDFIFETEQGLFVYRDKQLQRIGLIEDREVLSVATYQGRALALVRSAQQLSLLCHRQQNDWIEIVLPDVLRQARKAKPHLIADDTTIILLQSGSLAFYRDGNWKLSPWRKEEASLIESKRYLLQRDLLWIGTNRGEFGGGLVSYDLLQEKITPVQHHFGVKTTPVTTLRLNPGGNVWFSEGLHVSGRERGGLFRQRGDAWECFFYGSHLPLHQLTIIHPNQSWNDIADKERERLLQSVTDWNMPSCAIDSFDFGLDGTPVALTARFGPVLFDGQDWKPAFDEWPYTQVVDLLHTTDDRFLLATMYAGVFLWETKTNQIEAIKTK
jgi:hypothetical protein